MQTYGNYPRGSRMGDLVPGPPRTPSTDDVAWGVVDPRDPRYAGGPPPSAAPPDPRVPTPPPDQNRGYQADPTAPGPTSAPSTPPVTPPVTAPTSPAAPASGYQAALQRIRDAYKKYLGREGTEAEWASHLGNGRSFNPSNIEYGITNIQRSQEAQDYAKRQTAGPGETEAPKAPAGTHTYTGGALEYYGTGDIAGAENIKRGNVGTLSGFTEHGLNGDTSIRGSNSIKNVNGRFFSHLPAKPSSIDTLLADPEFRALFPNAKKVSFDKIDYGDGKPVDVLKAADPNTDTAESWAWMPESEAVPQNAGTGYTTWRSSQPSSTSAAAPTDDGFSRQTLVDPRRYPTAESQWTGPRMMGLDDQWLV